MLDKSFKRDENGCITLLNGAGISFDNETGRRRKYEKLADYEDIGLSPVDMRALTIDYEELKQKYKEDIATYEDTGLTPEEIYKIQVKCEVLQMENEALQNSLINANLNLDDISGNIERGELVEVVRCKDCRYKNTQMCRASHGTKYNLKKDKWKYKTMMEEDGFCHIGERSVDNA